MQVIRCAKLKGYSWNKVMKKAGYQFTTQTGKQVEVNVEKLQNLYFLSQNNHL